MTYKRINQGFTMMEVMIVIAILAIMAALVFVNLVPFMKSLYQKEMDETARELYVAAQNHLTIADSMGFLEGKTSKGTAITVDGKQARYYAVGADKSVLDSVGHETSILPYMLPFGSIDETVRQGGTYVIIYDPETMQVLQVFYGDPNGRYGNSVYFSSCPALDTYAGDGNRENRLDYNDAIIGWYGGASDGIAPGVLPDPKVTIENVERLNVKAWWPANTVDANDLEVAIIITGKTSQKSTPLLKLAKQTGALTDDDTAAGITTGSTVYRGCLDDITGNYNASLDTTRANILGDTGHFAERFAQFGLIPGEDVTISTFAYYTNTVNEKLYKVAKGPRVTTNSLFSSVGREVDSADPSNTYSAARISNIRHLENLAESISGYDREALTEAAPGGSGTGSSTGSMTTASALSETSRRNTVTTPPPGGMTTNAATSIDPAPTHAHQIADLSWSVFLTKVGGASKSVTTVTTATSPVATQTIAGKYMPVETGYDLSYYGGEHKVIGIDVDTTKSGSKATTLSENAGLFGGLQNADLRDIELVDFKVKAAAGNAGSLAGTLTGSSTVKNVLVHNAGKDGADGSLEISGTGSVGGLVGSMAGTSVEKSAASVYVRTTGASAGGLIGEAVGTAASPLAVTGCYAGGHTLNRDYDMTKTAASADQGRVNVVAATNAGGLIGNATNVNVTASYATNSATAATVGGLVGTTTGGAVSYSYAVGKVAGTTAGTFIGSLGTGTNLLKVDDAGTNRYAAETAGDMSPIGSDEDNADVEELFPTLEDYRAYVTRNRSAVPYDTTLGTAYNNLYPMPAAADLLKQADTEYSESGEPVWVTTHYGDWPKLETEVVNR